MFSIRLWEKAKIEWFPDFMVVRKWHYIEFVIGEGGYLCIYIYTYILVRIGYEFSEDTPVYPCNWTQNWIKMKAYDMLGYTILPNSTARKCGPSCCPSISILRWPTLGLMYIGSKISWPFRLPWPYLVEQHFTSTAMRSGGKLESWGQW